jgi:hypothetical protein
MKTTKYNYYKVIQTNSGYGWDDDDFHEADSTGHPKDYAAFKENLKAYYDNFNGAIRTIFRKELNNTFVA